MDWFHPVDLANITSLAIGIDPQTATGLSVVEARFGA